MSTPIESGRTCLPVPETNPSREPLAQIVQLRIQDISDNGRTLFRVTESLLPNPPIAYTVQERHALETQYATPAFDKYQQWVEVGRKETFEAVTRGINAGILIFDADDQILFIIKSHPDGEQSLDLPAGCSRRITGIDLYHTASRETLGEEALIFRNNRLIVPSREPDYLLRVMHDNYLRATESGLQLPGEIQTVITQAASYNTDSLYLLPLGYTPGFINGNIPEAAVEIIGPNQNGQIETGLFVMHAHGADLLYSLPLPFSIDPDTLNLRTADLDCDGTTCIDRQHAVLGIDELKELSSGKPTEAILVDRSGLIKGQIINHPFSPLAQAFVELVTK